MKRKLFIDMLFTCIVLSISVAEISSTRFNTGESLEGSYVGKKNNYYTGNPEVFKSPLSLHTYIAGVIPVDSEYYILEILTTYYPKGSSGGGIDCNSI